MNRYKIRDIDSGYHCSIIGTCLTLDEVRVMLEAAYKEDLSECTDYILHGMAVQAAGEISKLSNKITDKLNSKYKIELYKTSSINNHIDLERFWDKSYEEGNIAGAYWAILSHSNCTESLLNKVFGEVHMLSHLTGASERKSRSEIKEFEKEIEKLRFHLTDLKEKLSNSNDKNKSLQKENRLLKKENTALIASISEKGSSIYGENDLSIEIEKLKSKLEFSENRSATLLEKVNTLTEELHDYKEYTELLGKLSDNSENNAATPCARSCETEKDINLQKKKVLLVGGRLSMIPHCKSVVESLNGEFVYHDGGKEQAPTVLHGLAKSADIVICALDCVSHDASRCVKRICKDSDQKIIMLKNSGLSTFARELKRVV